MDGQTKRSQCIKKDPVFPNIQIQTTLGNNYYTWVFTESICLPVGSTGDPHRDTAPNRSHNITCIFTINKIIIEIYIGYWFDMEIYVRILERSNIVRHQGSNINYAPK